MNYRFLMALATLLGATDLSVAEIRFSDVTSSTGITFRHDDGSRGNYHIVETMCAGLALFDYDNDGDIDIYFLNGSSDSNAPKDAAARNVLYRNDGNLKFTDVTDIAGVGDSGHGLGVAVGDYDNDGDQDLYVNNYGPNVLYRNNGKGRFEDVTDKAGVANANRVGAGISFLDGDRDGDLDLFVANYVKFSPETHVPRTKQGYPIYGGPSDYPAETSTYFRNNGDGSFTDASQTSGIAAHAGPAMGIISADYDRDGDTDIFVANDGQMNFLFQNDGKARFKEVGLISGFAYDATGRVQASMGVDCGDFDNDGFLDVHVTSFQHELATLYRNIGGQLLEDVTRRTGAGIGSRAPVTWGNGFADFDNDGDKDLFIACGHVYDHLEKFDKTSDYESRNLLFDNLGNGRFANVSQNAGPGLQVKRCSRAAAFDDLDGDGDIDIVVLNLREMPTILRNDTPKSNAWIGITLKGTSSNRDAVGSSVEVVAGKTTQFAEVHSGRGYQGHHGTRLHFGLGNRAAIDELKIRWHSGATQVMKKVRANRFVTLEEPAPKQ